MTITPIALSGNYVAQLWLWIHNNPIAFLTAVMVCVTAYYARATTRYVRIASEQFAAQIEPVPTIVLENGRWLRNTFIAQVIITATRNDLVLVSGDILLRCEHGSIRVASQLNERFGDTISPGQPLLLKIELPFEHTDDRAHHHTPSLEGFLVYKDSRNVQSYCRELGKDGTTRIYRERDLERLRTWMFYRSGLAAARFSIWALNVQIAMQKALLQRGRTSDAKNRSPIKPKHPSGPDGG